MCYMFCLDLRLFYFPLVGVYYKSVYHSECLFPLCTNFHNTLLVLFGSFAYACPLEPSLVRLDWIKLGQSSFGYVGSSAKEYQMRYYMGDSSL
jgi:hypothetical protein